MVPLLIFANNFALLLIIKHNYCMPSNLFDYSLDFKHIDFRKNPELYRIGKGEQGVLLVEPYKSEILPYWKFRTEDIAETSSKKIFSLFESYLENKDFIGADMSRKFLQMGFTRARRYANHKSGKKYESGAKKDDRAVYPFSSGSNNKNNIILEQETDALTNEKARAAKIFKHYWFIAKDNPQYIKQKTEFKKTYYN